MVQSISHIICSLVLIVNVLNVWARADEAPTFVFNDYPYKDTTKNEMTFHEYESACDQSANCRHQLAVSRVRCIRECISPSCYKEIYLPDQLEEGEIDVRLNSFKGCFIQRLGRSRN